MNLSDVKNVYGRQTPNGNNSPNNKSNTCSLLLVLIIGVAAYLGYRYIMKEKSITIKNKNQEDRGN